MFLDSYFSIYKYTHLFFAVLLLFSLLCCLFTWLLRMNSGKREASELLHIDLLPCNPSEANVGKRSLNNCVKVIDQGKGKFCVQDHCKVFVEGNKGIECWAFFWAKLVENIFRSLTLPRHPLFGSPFTLKPGCFSSLTSCHVVLLDFSC